jgi:hypothetical protein
MKRRLQTDVEVAEALAAVGMQNVHLQTNVTNVPKLRHALSEMIKMIAHSERNDQNARSVTKILNRLFVKKTKKLNSSYLNLSTTSSEQWVS